MFVDGLVESDRPLDATRSACGCGRVQTGNIRQYVMWIAVGTVALFVLMSLYWNYAIGRNVED